MSDDWGYSFEAPTAKSWDAGNDDDDVADDWDASDSEAAPTPAAAAAPAAETKPAETEKPKAAAKPAPQTKQAKMRAELMAQQAKAKAAAEEAAARRAKLEAEERARRADPNYLAQAKERERLDMERAERELIDDFLGEPAAPKVTETAEQKSAQAARAAALAASTGLGDGADVARGVGAVDAGIPADKSDTAAPNPLDSVSLATKEEVTEFTKQLSDKINSLRNSALALELLRQLSHSVGPQLKFDDLSEYLRIVTVIKNEAQKAQQNKKKPAKAGKAVIKGLGSARDDYSSTQYDDMF